MRFLYSNISVLDPIVGAVATTDPSVILYINVVLPALSKPRIHIFSSCCPNNEFHSRLNATPIVRAAKPHAHFAS